MEFAEEVIGQQILETQPAVDDLLDERVAHLDEDRLLVVVKLGHRGFVTEYRTSIRRQRVEVLRGDRRLAVSRSQTHLAVCLRAASRRSTRAVRT